MKTKSHCININMLQDAIGASLVKSLLFAHAISGCDTTSAFFGIEKLKALRFLQKSSEHQEYIQIFGETDIQYDQMLSVGEQFVISLYQNNMKNIKSLDELRALIYKSPNYVSIQRMPPTTRSCYFHLLRVHLQINT